MVRATTSPLSAPSRVPVCPGPNLRPAPAIRDLIPNVQRGSRFQTELSSPTKGFALSGRNPACARYGGVDRDGGAIVTGMGRGRSASVPVAGRCQHGRSFMVFSGGAVWRGEGSNCSGLQRGVGALGRGETVVCGRVLRRHRSCSPLGFLW